MTFKDTEPCECSLKRKEGEIEIDKELTFSKSDGKT